MPRTPGPSTAWTEHVAPDEAERFERHAGLLTQLQAERSGRWGRGRALHRKALAVAHGSLEVLDGLPGFARHGLFAEPRDYEVHVRLSNGGLDPAADSVPDVRGLSFRVFGVRGESALGGPAVTQDFTLINQESFAFARSDEFVAFVVAASQGNSALFRHVLARYGVLGASRQLGRMAWGLHRPFSGFATEPLYSALPMANGPYAVRVRLLPSGANGKPAPRARRDWAADFCGRLARLPLHWDLQLQYFASEALTPIEDASVSWPTPYTTVARLMLPVQDAASQEAQALARAIEADSFDPWQALAEHRPLGEVQRARRIAYHASRRHRGSDTR
ncbi:MULTISPECIES: catalase [Ramlibacter]|uniref:Catalase n=1 Tax=Ramlibacter pinisoli TaxID=2682844 RepID=A0A6N8IPP4_9BURK|nr:MULTISPECIES: catalase [Ramlibacter]MBA2963893.1 catalase [Ramlibacter sp. CGMCC 1.13660]MVQ28859.1 catalase [Ramlibacter pinisoli]